MTRNFIAALCILAAVPVFAQWKPAGATTGSMDYASRKLHQPGTIVDKALEPLDGGRGAILLLLSMQ